MGVSNGSTTDSLIHFLRVRFDRVILSGSDGLGLEIVKLWWHIGGKCN
jgi:hypothetical protein